MASETPQVEDGFVRIANELFRAIRKAGLSKRELLVVMAVMQKTYGFNKKSDDMTMTQLADETDLALPHVSATVRDLHLKGVLSVEPGEYGKVIGVVKNYHAWKRDLPAQEVTKTVIKTQSRKTETVTSNMTETVINVTETVTPEVTETVSDEVTETVIVDDRNGHCGLPKRSFAVTETVNTKDNPKRQLQKTTPKDRVPAALPATGPVWSAYAAAYEQRYGVPPVRNATVNTQLANLVKRIGADDAPHVAAFYVHHNSAFYVRRGHVVGAMLADAEKLRTEWATNRRVTDTEARQADRRQAAGDEWHDLYQEATAREA